MVVGLDNAVYGLVVPILPTYAERWGMSDSVIGLFFATYAAALLVVSALLLLAPGLISPWRLVVGGGVLLVVSTTVFAFANASPTVLFSARALQGVAAAAAWSGAPALLARLYPAAHLGRAMGFLLTGASVGLLVGPPLGGALYEGVGHSAPFVVVAVAGAVVTAAAIALSPQIRLLARASDTRRMTGMIGMLARDGNVRISLALVATSAGTLAMLEPIAPLRLHRLFAAGATQTGMVFGVAVLALGIAAPIAGGLSDRWGRLPVARVGMLALAGAVVMFVASSSFPMAIVSMGLVGVTVAFAQTPVLPFLADEAERIGRGNQAATVATYLLYNMAYGVGLLLGPSLGNASAAEFGLIPTALGVTAICAFVAMATLRRSRSRRL